VTENVGLSKLSGHVTLRGRDSFPGIGGCFVGSVQTFTLSEQAGHPYVTLRSRKELYLH